MTNRKLWNVVFFLLCFVISMLFVNFGFLTNISLRAGLKWIPNSISASTIICDKLPKDLTNTSTIETCRSMTVIRVTENQNCQLDDILKNTSKAFAALNSRLAEINRATTQTDNKSVFQKNHSVKIGVLIPTTTRTLKCHHFIQLSLFEKCIPSMINSLSQGFYYKIYLGFDSSDIFFTKMRNSLQNNSFHISLVKVLCQTFVAAVNTIAKVAYEEGMDYMVRINDDTEFISLNWTALAVDALRNYDPPNVGVVGPTCKEGNPSILTHDMVHRSHLEIFNYYYPPAFENWWADDWITETYQPDRFTKLPTWGVHHLLQDRRYPIDKSIESKLAREVRDSKTKLYCYASAFKKQNNTTKI